MISCKDCGDPLAPGMSRRYGGVCKKCFDKPMDLSHLPSLEEMAGLVKVELLFTLDEMETIREVMRAEARNPTLDGNAYLHDLVMKGMPQ